MGCGRFGFETLQEEAPVGLKSDEPLLSVGGASSVPDGPRELRLTDAGLVPAVDCQIGSADCDGNISNGCETQTGSSVSSCGRCSYRCGNLNGTNQCVAGLCDPTCATGYGDCDGDPSNGCEQLLSSPAYCGACATSCDPNNATVSCQAAVCIPLCSEGFGDCDSNPNNGCEALLQTDPGNCGSCGTSCPDTEVCEAGSCVPTLCDPGLAECDGEFAILCETNVETAREHCGFCNNLCTIANGTSTCTGGDCEVGTCASGFADCDGVAGTGCEVNLSTTSEHCGACGAACSNANGNIQCVASQCDATCTIGYGDCDGSLQNGCEQLLDGIEHCGACGNECQTNRNDETPNCNSGLCETLCDLNGTFALKLTASGSWPASTYIKAGSGIFEFWLGVDFVQSGNIIEAKATECGRIKPPVVNSANEPLIHGFPDALYDNDYLPSSNATVTLSASTPGASLSWPLSANQMGINMANPTTDSWPNSASGVAAGIRVDMDRDGKVGMTGDYSEGPTFPRTSASFGFNRADLFYFSSRLRYSLGGSLSSCSVGSGSATVVSTDMRLLGCNYTDSTQDCTQTESDFLDSNTPSISMQPGTYVLTRVEPGATCATVRSALP